MKQIRANNVGGATISLIVLSILLKLGWIQTLGKELINHLPHTASEGDLESLGFLSQGKYSRSLGFRI